MGTTNQGTYFMGHEYMNKEGSQDVVFHSYVADLLGEPNNCKN